MASAAVKAPAVVGMPAAAVVLTSAVVAASVVVVVSAAMGFVAVDQFVVAPAVRFEALVFVVCATVVEAAVEAVLYTWPARQSVERI